MLYDAIDSVLLAAADLNAACRPYEQLGLRLSPLQDGPRTLHIGGSRNLFTVRFLADVARDSPLAKPLRVALEAGRSLFAVVLRVTDLDLILDDPVSRGVTATRGGDGTAELAWLPLQEQAGTDLLLVQHAHPLQKQHAVAEDAGLLAHALPLKRLDHLAAVTHDLDVKTRFWSDVLGVAVAGEVVTPTMVIRQLRFGDAVLELLGPAGPDSPLWQRPRGLVNMASWEVSELEAAVAQIRAVGFTVSEPGAGPLPGTRIATVPGTELAGINLQLLQYV